MFNEITIYNLLHKKISGYEKTYISLKSIIDFVKNENKLMYSFIMTDGYSIFTNVIADLIENRIIELMPSSKATNKLNPPLRLKYKVIKQLTDYKNIELKMLQLYKRINISKYYLNNPKDYLKDEKEIKIINDFLNSGETGLLTVNERSYELFGDEKFLKNPEKQSEGEVLLRNLGLCFEDLSCYYVYEPFIYNRKDDFYLKTNRRILIIENKDTYWSLHKIIFDCNKYNNIDMLIYGEGKKIINSFQFIERLNGRTDDNFLYFGDLDREGINIFYMLNKRYPEYNLKLCIRLYETMLDITEHKILNASKKPQKLQQGADELFLNNMREQYHSRINEILQNNFYIPQEALNFNYLDKIAEGGDL